MNMPSREEHCQHTVERYGVTGEDIHEWMDEPSLILGPQHRNERHDPKQEIPPIFITKYGEELARNIILDHIFLDVKSVKGKAVIHTKRRTDSLDKVIDEFLESEDNIRRIEVENIPATFLYIDLNKRIRERNLWYLNVSIVDNKGYGIHDDGGYEVYLESVHEHVDGEDEQTEEDHLEYISYKSTEEMIDEIMDLQSVRAQHWLRFGNKKRKKPFWKFW